MRYPIGYVRPNNRHSIPGPDRERWDQFDAEHGILERALRDQEYEHRRYVRSARGPVTR